jgi:TolB-like protein/class 3 adenylate cyclase/Tfp pilus assembly protein PilF
MVRRLTAIMFTDMVGYTALLQEDERRARESRSRQRAVLEESIPRHDGRILEVHGDGTLSIFPSAVQAVHSAVEIQRKLAQEPRVPLRIGIHSGDVIHDEDGVFGDGVNVASRIQSLASPGGVLISAKVFDEVKNQPEISARSLGEFDLKNVKLPMGVYAVLGEGLHVPESSQLASHRTRQRRSVAVLPFVNMSPDPENEFFSDGISEEIINALTRVDDLQVTARTSSFAYKNRNEDVREIAAGLGVGTVLEGSVRRLGNRVRITAQLIDAKDGYHLFSEVYDRSIEDIFETQDEIARTIVRRLERGLGDPGRAQRSVDVPLISAHTHDTEAYTEYLKGLFHWRQWTPDSVRKAIQHYERSAEMDPLCALPLTGLATAYTFLGAMGQVHPDRAFPLAEAAARKALEIEEDAGESHLALASVQLFYHWDFDAAYRGFQRALSLTPGSAEVHHIYSMYLQAVGDLDGSLEEAGIALQLDPLSLPINQSVAQAYLMSRRFDEALAQTKRILEMDPDFRSAIETLGWLHVLGGRFEEALEAFESIVERTGDRLKVIPHRAYAYAALGRDEDAQAMARLLEVRREEQPDIALDVDFAILSLALGDRDAAFKHLEGVVEKRLGAIIFMGRSPLWDPIRDDPRYEALMRRVGLSGAASA